MKNSKESISSATNQEGKFPFFLGVLVLFAILWYVLHPPFSEEDIPDLVQTSEPIRLGSLIFIAGGTLDMVFTEEDTTYTCSAQVDDFYLGEKEVTVKEYAEYLTAIGKDFILENKVKEIERKVACQEENVEPAEFEKTKKHFDSEIREIKHVLSDEQLPMVEISWLEATEYCNWRSAKENLSPCYSSINDSIICDFSANGYRLPKVNEWEFAARSRGQKQRWAGTNAVKRMAKYVNFQDNFLEGEWAINYPSKKSKKDKNDRRDGYLCAAPVGSLLPNSMGLYDMSGNVKEFCWDLYSYPCKGGKINQNDRTACGGSWQCGPIRCQTDSRWPMGMGQQQAAFDTGFRLARSKVGLD